MDEVKELEPVCVQLVEGVLQKCAWIRIEQGLPPLGMICFLNTERGVLIGCRDDVGDGWCWSRMYDVPDFEGDSWEGAREGDDMNVRHWMPLPKPPEK